MKRLHLTILTTLIALGAPALVACGNSDDKSDKTGDADKADAGKTNDKPADGDMTTDDDMPTDKADAGKTDDKPADNDMSDAGMSNDKPADDCEAYLQALKDHPNVDCGSDDVCELSTTSKGMTKDLELMACDGVRYELKTGQYFWVGNDKDETVFTINPGVTIYGGNGSAVVVRRGSKIMAEGTAKEPIVFTSKGDSDGIRVAGQWGGLVLNGRAPQNATDGDAEGEVASGLYGGDEADDSSGVLKYVRVEFAGNLASDTEELNGIAFQGVGSGTVIDYVQVHHNSDDGVEFFGGTVSVSHLVLSGEGDDSLDWTSGWTGSAQFVAIDQYRKAEDYAGDNGIEGDNLEGAHDATPVSAPVLANITIIGSAKTGEGIQLRRGTHAEIWNSVVADSGGPCLLVQDEETEATINNSFIACAKDAIYPEGDWLEKSQDAFEAKDSNNTLIEDGGYDDLGLDEQSDELYGYLVPAKDSDLLGVGKVEADGLEDVDYAGAFGEGDNWAAGWTTDEQE